MPLNLTVNDGEYTPFLKYNAKAGRFYARAQGIAEDIEVEKPRLAIDMANIRTGWFCYIEGAGPEKVYDPSPDREAPRPPSNPNRQFKRGFEVMVIGQDNLPVLGYLGLREWSSTSGNTIAAILKMHAAYEAGMHQNPGKVPFYRNTKVLPITGKYGTNYEPVFELIGWVDRVKVPAFDEHLEGQAMRSPPHSGNGNGARINNPAMQGPNGGPPPAPPPTHDDLNDAIPF